MIFLGLDAERQNAHWEGAGATFVPVTSAASFGRAEPDVQFDPGIGLVGFR